MTSSTVRDGADEPGRLPTGNRLTADFLQAVAWQMGDGSLTPGALTRATAEVLPVDGVGISTIAGGLRLPLGTSTAAAELAEELETTLGAGPCLAAAQAQTPCLSDLPDLLERWPVYSEVLTRQTAYRSTAAVPLMTPDGRVFAALDLYAEDPRLGRHLDLDDIAAQIGASVAALLDVCLRPVRTAAAHDVLPEWYEDVTARRLEVWVAIGMVMESGVQPDGDALSLLRAYAYSHDCSLDQLAEDVVLGRLEVERVLR